MCSSQPDNRDPTINEEASVLHWGYDVGYFDKRDIERWADSKIALIDVPADALLNLSMIRETHPLDVLNLLKALCSDARPEQIVATQIGFIGLCFQQGKISLSSAIGGLYSLLRQHNFSVDEEGMIYWLDDAYDLAVSGYHGTLAEVEQELRKFLFPYVERLQNRHKHLMALHCND